MGPYLNAYQRSITDPEAFWAEAAGSVDWIRPPTRVLDDSRPPFYRWFPDGELNTCHNALDRHVLAGRGDQPALIYDSPVTGSRRAYTYAQLLSEVALFAGALRSLGVNRGDRVVLYMAMVPETVIAMLACARLGAVHSVVFGGFGSSELAARIDDARPVVIVATSCGIEPTRVVRYGPLLEAALATATHKPAHVVVLQRPQSPWPASPGLRSEATGATREGDAGHGARASGASAVSSAQGFISWDHVVTGAEPADCVPVAATDPLYILYTSGTTGRPKGIVRDNGGHAVALQWSMSAVYDIGPGDVFWAASDVGWVVGHSYIVYAPLLVGATTVLYEGKPVGTPDAGAFFRVAREHNVKALFTAPTAFRAIRKEDPDGALIGGHPLKTLFLAGERLDPETYHWAVERLGVPVVDHWWQTETGWPIVANLQGLEPMPTKAGSPTVPVPGYAVRVVDGAGDDVPPGTDGAIVIRLPLPPGCLPTLWNDDERYVSSYLSAYPGHYLTGDGGRFDEDGYLYVMGRTDDVINVAGHRLSTGAMEEVLAGHPAVAECAVIGVADPMKGQVPRGLVVLKAGASADPDAVAAQLVALVRERIGPVAAFRQVTVVPALPKTRSGKILRKTMRGIADGREEPVPSTIEDPAVLDTLRPMLAP